MLHTYSDGKMSIADIGIYLGLDEQNVKVVGESLYEQQVIKVECGYALKSALVAQLVNIINLRCGGSYSDQSAGVYPTLDAVGGQSQISCGVSIQQLAREMLIAEQDVGKLLLELFDYGEKSSTLDPSIVLLTDGSTGEPSEVANQQVLDLMKDLFEKQVLSALRGVTTPVSVSIFFCTLQL